MKNETYAEKVKERLRQKAGNKLGDKAKSHEGQHPDIFLNPSDNMIDGVFPDKKSVKGTLSTEELKMDRVGNLVSSFAMCVSYFKQFFRTEEGEKAFCRILTRLGIDMQGAEIQNAAFELLPSEAYRNDPVKRPYDRTNFDFFLELTDGRRISWEIKFTEAEFGKISSSKSPEAYARQWERVYSKLYRTSVYRKADDPVCTNGYACLRADGLTGECSLRSSCAICEFYSHYQIRRNIVWAQHAGDHVMFLTPRENTSLDAERAYIEAYADQYGKGYIHNVYWEDLLPITLQETAGDSALHDYYARFKSKYLD